MRLSQRSVAALLAGVLLMPAMACASQPGWYMALDAGQARYSGANEQQWTSLPLGSTPGWTTTTGVTRLPQGDTHAAAFGFSAGYQFNAWLGVEAGYEDLGNVHAKGEGDYSWRCNPPPGGVCLDIIGTGKYAGTASMDVRGWTVAAIGSWPVSQRWALYAKAGAFAAHLRFDASSAPTPIDNTVTSTSMHDSSTQWDPVYGIGADWSPLDHWSLRLEWDDHADLGLQPTTGKFDVHELSAGLVYAF